MRSAGCSTRTGTRIAASVERRYSLEATAILNDAYRILARPGHARRIRPARRGLRDRRTALQGRSARTARRGLRTEHGARRAPAGDREVVPQLDDDAPRASWTCRTRSTPNSSPISPGTTPSPTPESRLAVLAEIRAMLNRRRYIRNLVSEVDKAADRAATPDTHEHFSNRLFGKRQEAHRRHRPRHHQLAGRRSWTSPRPQIIPGAGRRAIWCRASSASPTTARSSSADAARQLLIDRPDRTVYSRQAPDGPRRRGRRRRAEALPVPHRRRQRAASSSSSSAAGSFTPPEISAQVLRELKHRAEAFLGEDDHARPSSPCRPTSTTRSARPPRTPAASPGSKCCAWSTSRPPPRSPTVSTSARKASSPSTTSAAAPSTSPSCACTTASSKCSPPTATRTSAATTSTICLLRIALEDIASEWGE